MGCMHAQPTMGMCAAGGCPPGYQCGPYGCALRRARARSSNTMVAAGQPGWSATEEEEKPKVIFLPVGSQWVPTTNEVIWVFLQSPNQVFMRCCEERGLPDSLLRMYLKQDACPVQASAEIQFCAAQGRDHRECCARNGVTTTLAGSKCLVFCDQRPGNVTQLDVSYVSCYDRFDSMKRCFWHDLMNRLDNEARSS
ncbi:unnamed protein product [Anisakis simplex]|uniref:Domain of unknown function DB domain-containing protein n=1 Tax=Anisakis simplex TaxID=6269 RepID=A0A3P6N8I8_ANISI|nr:unnamed protein product [Anisakis simplex]